MTEDKDDDCVDEEDCIVAKFDATEGEYLEFDRIPDAEKLHPDRTLCGYLKVWSLLRPDAKRKRVVEAADHDIVYLSDLDKLVDLTQDDIIYLRRCGIHFNEEFWCLADFT